MAINSGLLLQVQAGSLYDRAGELTGSSDLFVLSKNSRTVQVWLWDKGALISIRAAAYLYKRRRMLSYSAADQVGNRNES